LTCIGIIGQDIYFHRNHPIKWVRVIGVVVAIEEYETRRIYTIDDSSGSNIDCSKTTPPTYTASTLGQKQTTAQAQGETAGSATLPDTRTADIDGEIDIGHVLDVRGSLKVFRDVKAIRVEKILQIRSTEQEMRFWTKLAEFRKDVLNEPWILDRREVRRCRKEAEGQDEKKQKKRKATEISRDSSKRRSPPPEKMKNTAEHLQIKTTGLERKTKRASNILHIAGKYDTLGI
jgi:hypothetical protein